MSISARSVTSGSMAAFSRMVSPSARTAAVRMFSVPVTVIFGKRKVVPRRRLALGLDVAVFDFCFGSEGFERLNVQVDGTRADGAAPG